MESTRIVWMSPDGDFRTVTVLGAFPHRTTETLRDIHECGGTITHVHRTREPAE